MDIAWGLVLVVLGSLAWLGQALSRFAPERATRLGLVEAQESVEPVYWADIVGEALWDVMSLWALVAAGILLILGSEAWAFLGLAGGAIYVYFAGRGIVTRLELRRRGFRIGEPASVRLGLAMLGVWGVAGLITVAAAAADLA